MPILINELVTTVPDNPVPQMQANPMQDRVPVTQPEYEVIKTLDLLEERRQRLEFD
ncbi:MAG TPA: hypothetical protein VNR18_13915 [Hyphomicrobiales bacterium]|nr:hypothetical protein [Hyphomicrobiales bacterium]